MEVTLYDEFASVCAEDVLDNRKSQSSAPQAAGAAGVHTKKPLGQSPNVFGRDADAIVYYGHFDLAGGQLTRADFDMPARLAVLDRVVHEIG